MSGEHVDSGDYTYEHTRGWTCSACGQWVPDGETHVCPGQDFGTSMPGYSMPEISLPSEESVEITFMPTEPNTYRVITYEHELVIALLRYIAEGLRLLALTATSVVTVDNYEDYPHYKALIDWLREYPPGHLEDEDDG
jgi:hypothetical protein